MTTWMYILVSIGFLNELSPGEVACKIKGKYLNYLLISKYLIFAYFEILKLLGIHLDCEFKFDEHVSHIARKATRQLNCLKRVAFALPISVKLLLYKSFVLSNFSYCPAVWHHCGKKNVDMLERIQFRALKFIYSDYNTTYAELLTKANLPSLEIGRLRSIAVEVYKALNNLSPPFINNDFNLTSTRYNLRSGGSIQTNHSRTTKYGLHSFKNFGAMLWHQIPLEIRQASDLKTFKTMIKSWFGPNCKCAFCR